MPIKERDIVLQGRDGGEDTIDLPITRLGNIESGAEVKEKPAQGDYIPIIDSEDSEQMKKFPAKVLTDAVATADRALKAVQRVAYVIDTLPYPTTALTFTGEEQSPVWGAFDPEKLEIGGDVSAVNAGEYEAVFTPKGDYVWADESVEPRTVTWTIGRASAGAVPSVAGSLTYTGAEQSPAWTGYDPEKIELCGDASAINAGSYTASFTPKANYQWSDGTTGAKTVVWTIGRTVISAVPSQSGNRTYNGAAQSPKWANYDANKLTLGGTTSGTNAGSYTASFTPKANYQWSDGTTTAKTVGWSIGKAAGSLGLNTAALALGLSATIGYIAATKVGDGAISAASSNPAVASVSVSGTTVVVTAKASGNATITVSVGEGSNHSAPANKTCSVSVSLPSTTLNSNSWAMIRAVSDAGQGPNWWKVGDTKSITINGKVGITTFSNLTIDVFILGFNHNSGQEGANKIHFQMGKISGKSVALCDDSYMNGHGGNAEEFKIASPDITWNNSQMRNKILGNSSTPTNPAENSLMAAMPAELRAVMKSCVKYTSTTMSSTDYISLMSEVECYGKVGSGTSNGGGCQLQYDYYKAGNSKVKYKHNSLSETAEHWSRSTTGSYGNWCSFHPTSDSAAWVDSQPLGISPIFFV